MALEAMRAATLKTLQQHDSSAAMQAAYLARFDEAANHKPGEPLPCPACFALGLTSRLKAIKAPGPKLAAVRCEVCELELAFPDPD